MNDCRHTPMLMTGVGDVLTELALDIETLGASLCTDADMVARHGEHLQDIDRISQTARQLAAVLKADWPEDAVDAIGIDALRDQLRGATSISSGQPASMHAECQ